MTASAPTSAPPGRTPSGTEFLLLKRSTRIGTTSWTGGAIIGPRNIYILKKAIDPLAQSTSLNNRTAQSALRLADAVVRTLAPDVDLPGIPYRAIPANVRAHPSWPVREELTCDVLVIPRESVSVIRHTFASHEFVFTHNGVPIAIRYGDFAGWRVRRFLASTGWPLHWTGRTINISKAAAADALERPRAPLIVYAALAVGFISLLILMTYMALPKAYQERFDVVGIGSIFTAIAGFLIGIAASKRNV